MSPRYAKATLVVEKLLRSTGKWRKEHEAEVVVKVTLRRLRVVQGIFGRGEIFVRKTGEQIMAPCWKLYGSYRHSIKLPLEAK